MMPSSTNDMANPKEGYVKYCIALRGKREGKPPLDAVESQSKPGTSENIQTYFEEICLALFPPNHLES
jgi:hypothetical protein